MSDIEGDHMAKAHFAAAVLLGKARALEDALWLFRAPLPDTDPEALICVRKELERMVGALNASALGLYSALDACAKDEESDGGA